MHRSTDFDAERQLRDAFPSGTCVAKCMTFRAIEKVTQVSPNCIHRLWIDDLPQRIQGSHKAVRHGLLQCRTDTCEALKVRGLNIA